jgi:hypothetical protein
MKSRLPRDRWLAGLAVIALLLGMLAGCQPTYMTEKMWQDTHACLPRDLEQKHEPLTNPIIPLTAQPATVLDPERPPRYLNLQEAIAIALEDGNVFSRAPEGRADDFLLAFNAPASLNGQSEKIRVLSINNPITFAAIDTSIARFDPIWISTINWIGTDSISGVPNLPGYLQTVPGQTATFQTALVKALPTGGVAELSFLTDYRQLTNTAQNNFAAVGPFNPQYSARVSVGFEQPLWRDWGVEINQLLSRFPSVLGQGFLGTNIFTGFNNHQNATSAFVDRQTEGILISRLRFDQQRTEFERNVHIMVKNVEIAYWNLYDKYGQLYAFEENLRILYRAEQESYNKTQVLGGREGAGAPQYNLVLGQYHEFRGERLRALHEVLDAERQLRRLLNLPIEDGTRLVPITPPTVAEFRPEWKSSLKDALTLRPELQLARDNLRYHQYLLSIQKNNMKPDLRAYFRVEPFGDGNTLTGNGTVLDGSNTLVPTNALKSLATQHLLDYQIGLNLQIPLGYRAEMAAVRAARLELTQAYLVLRDQEERATSFLGTQFEELAYWWFAITVHRAERLGYYESLRTRIALIKAGKQGQDYSDPSFLDAQRRYAAALVKEYDAIAQYNISLARLEYAKGTVLRYNNIHIAEGALPECVQERAVEHEKERTRSLVVHERPDALKQPGRLVGTKETAPPPVDGWLPAPPDAGPGWEPPPPTPEKKPAPAAQEKKPEPIAPKFVPAQMDGRGNLLPVDQRVEQPAPRIVPAKSEQRWTIKRVELPKPEPLPTMEEPVIEFKGTGTKTTPAPAPLPTLESTPLPKTGAATLPPRTQASSGFITLEEAVAPRIVRGAVGDLNVIEIADAGVKRVHHARRGRRAADRARRRRRPERHRDRHHGTQVTVFV